MVESGVRAVQVISVGREPAPRIGVWEDVAPGSPSAAQS